MRKIALWFDVPGREITLTRGDLFWAPVAILISRQNDSFVAMTKFLPASLIPEPWMR